MTWHLSVDSIAGIRAGEATIVPGSNAVRASNWQGKSSLLTAIETAMGTGTVLTEGEDHGRVTLDAERSVRVDLVRENGTVRREGEPYLTDERTRVVADLYAFLGEDNEVRRAVREGENLEGVLTRPLEFENIDERIADLRSERNSVDAERSRAREAAEELPAAERRVSELEAELESLRSERAEMAEELSVTGDLDEKQEALSNAVAERENVEDQIERLERTVERTEEKLAAAREDLAAIEVPDTGDLESELATAREEQKRATRDAELLQSVYAPTRRILEEDRLDLIADVEYDLMGDEVECWTCGQETTREVVEENLEALSERVTELREAAHEHERRVERLEERREETRDAERRRADLEDEISELADRLAERQASLRSARDRLADVEDRIDELSETVDATNDRLTDVDSDIKYTERSLEEAREERDELEQLAGRSETLQSERAELTEEITRLRTRKEEMKQRTREAFDEAIREIVDRFETGFETARLTSEFELVVARDGREASLDALSEGEIELIGIVAALAGHRAYDAAGAVPVMLVDELGGLSEENLRRLVDYLEGRCEYLVFTTYPEYESDDFNTVDPTDWDVVSPATS